MRSITCLVKISKIIFTYFRIVMGVFDLNKESKCNKMMNLLKSIHCRMVRIQSVFFNTSEFSQKAISIKDAILITIQQTDWFQAMTTFFTWK